MRLLTRGSPLGLRNQLARIRPDLDVSTLVYEGRPQPPAYAQMRHYAGEATAALSFAILAPMQIAQKLPVLLDDLTELAGDWQVLALLADIPEGSELMPSFRRSSFIVWARQTVFQLNWERKRSGIEAWDWRPWLPTDLPAMQSLHHRLVPGQFQAIEAVTRKRLQGLVLKDHQGRLLAYADLDQGPKGFWAQVFALPEMNDPLALNALGAALAENFDLLGRPIFLACRSYQPWLQELAAQCGMPAADDRALLVRFLSRYARDLAQQEAAEELAFGARVPVAQLSGEAKEPTHT